MENLVIKNLNGKITNKVPVWLMRQAGRYMEEYRNIRSKFPDFIEMCKNSTLSDLDKDVAMLCLEKMDN